MEIEIRLPKTEDEWEDYYDLRYRVLRQPLNQPRGSEKNDGDEDGIHFALYERIRGGDPKLYGYFKYDPKIIVT